jgi:hypothetical protein
MHPCRERTTSTYSIQPYIRYRASAVINTPPAIALAPWYTGLMKKNKEKPVPVMVRLYKKHRKAVKRAAKLSGFSEAHIIRAAIELSLELV